MKNLLFYSLILFTSCTTFDYNSNKCDCSLIQKEFDEFVHQSKLRGVKLKNKRLEIKFVSFIENRVVARTYSWKNLIEFDTTLMHDYKREQVIYHELGHFYLDRGHVDGTIENEGLEYPISIMTQGVSIEFDLISSELKDYYFDELFYN